MQPDVAQIDGVLDHQLISFTGISMYTHIYIYIYI